MARISGVDIPKQKRGVIALTYIYGIGRSRAQSILFNAKVNQDTKPEEIQTLIYACGKENGYSNDLRSWFKLIYEVIFGEPNGPRMGFFISFFGLKETIDLMEKKLKIQI